MEYRGFKIEIIRRPDLGPEIYEVQARHEQRRISMSYFQIPNKLVSTRFITVENPSEINLEFVKEQLDLYQEFYEDNQDE